MDVDGNGNRETLQGEARLPVAGYAAFMATLGVIAAALGGNLEEEGEIKAELLFDEET